MFKVEVNSLSSSVTHAKVTWEVTIKPGCTSPDKFRESDVFPIKLMLVSNEVFGSGNYNIDVFCFRYLKCVFCIVEGLARNHFIISDFFSASANVWYKKIIKDLNSNFGFNGYNTRIELRLQFLIIEEIPKVGNSIMSDYENILKSELFSDVTIKSSEGVDLKANKAILAARSEVFAAQFAHNTTECLTNIVNSPFEFEVLEETLLSIYTDQSPKIHEMPEKLLVAADYYNLDRLKIACEEALIKKLSTDNAIDILQLADQQSALLLLDETLNFIKNNKGAIIGTDGWNNIESAKLLKKIYERVVT